MLLLGDTKPDGLLIDINMPGLDGCDVCRRVRKHRSLDDVVLMAITAHYTTETAAEAVEAGAVALLPKPFATAQVLGFVRDVKAAVERAKYRDWKRESRARIAAREKGQAVTR